MALSKTEINLRRLLASAPKQQNQTKLIHYIITLRELLEKLEEETKSGGITSFSKSKLSDFSEKIEALAATLSAPPLDSDVVVEPPPQASDTGKEDWCIPSVDTSTKNSAGLRRRAASQVKMKDETEEITETTTSTPVKLDAAAQAHIEKHRKLQEDLTDEMVGLARQLKESSLLMSQSVQNTGKILDSTERAVEHSLASTGRVNVSAGEIYSQSSKTSCLTWLLIFVMTCMFMMVVLLIRVT